MRKEGEQGRKKINQWTRYATIVLALFQSFLIAVALENGQFGENAVVHPGWGFRLMAMMTLTTGTAFIMWLGEQITVITSYSIHYTKVYDPLRSSRRRRRHRRGAAACRPGRESVRALPCR